MKNLLRCFAIILTALVLYTPVFAQDDAPKAPNPPRGAPDIMQIPVIKTLSQQGTKFYYLGERNGLHGWFLVKDNRVQVFYVSPDKKALMFGGLFSEDGANITGLQITSLLDQYPGLKAQLTAAAQQQADILATGTPDQPQTTEGGIPTSSLSPGEQLYQDLVSAAGVTVGAESAPLLLMIVDPRCPHCKETWREVRKYVSDNKLRVRLVPIGAQGSESEREAAQLLRVEAPFTTWDKFVEGDSGLLAGTPDELQFKAVRENFMLVEKWRVQATPFLVYRAKDNRIKIVQGRPERMAAVMTDLLP